MNASLHIVKAHQLPRRGLAIAGVWLLVVFAVLLLGRSGAALAATATASPSACSSVAGPGAVAWGNPTRATAQDGSYAATANFKSTSTQYLQCTGYNFAIPAGATIDGITVTVWRLASNNACCSDAAMRLVKAGTIQATDRSTATVYPNANTAEAHGGAADLWGGAWTVADINNANFGAAFAAKNTTATNRTVSVDYIQITVNYTPLAVVSSINLASTNPAYAGDAVTWTVVFNTAVTGVDATDFALVSGGGVAGASITSVTGIGTTWTVTANSGTSAGTLGLNLVDNDSIINADGVPLGGAGAGNGNFTGQVYTISPPFCSPPSNIPAGVTVSCQCDRFGRASLNPSTIFGSNWAVSASSGPFVPAIDTTYNLLQLTQAVGNESTAATVPGIFPAAGNYISVEFLHYAYGGSGADGMAVTLSDYSVPAVPGAFGGSLGYAQKTGISGFAGGWVGVALDEYGNYENSSEGRFGGSCSPQGCATLYPESVGVRGSGSGTAGYNFLAAATGVNPIIDNRGSATPAPGYFYQVIVDARNDPASTSVTVNRDTTGTGNSYTQLISIPNVYTTAITQGFTQSPVPANWQISFTGSTGGSTNIHEIGGLRICAQSEVPPTGGTASGFSAIDEAYPAAPTVPAYQNFQTGHIYMKLAGTSFKLWVAALTSNGISTAYSTVSSKYVSVKFVDNSSNICGPDSARTCNNSCTNSPAVEAGATQIATFASGTNTGVASPLPTFTLNSAWKNLIVVMKECTTSACTAFTATAPACSVDSFSVRPTGIVSVTSSGTPTAAYNAAYGGSTTSTPFVATGNPFSLTATVTGSGYTGVPKINSASVQFVSPATVTGTLAGTFAAATSSGGNSTATGSAFTYSEVGIFHLLGPSFPARIPGVYDDNWTAIDSDPTKNDCDTGTSATAYSNAKDANGKFGCNFGITADTDTGGHPSFGRFTPAYFDITAVVPGCNNAFTYAGLMPVGLQPSVPGKPFSVTATARNASGQPTQNYDGGGFAQSTTFSDAGTATNFTGNPLAAAGYTLGVGTLSTITYRFAAKESPPQTLTLRAIDADSVSSAGHVEPTTLVESGRVRIQNANGSELVAVPLPMRAEYYTGTANGWLTNSADVCTSVALSQLTLSNTTAPTSVTGTSAKTVGSQTTTATIAHAPVSLGDAGLSFSPPGPGGTGYVDVLANLATMTWLQYDWDGNGVADNNPQGRATFGSYQGSPRQIYLRERY